MFLIDYSCRYDAVQDAVDDPSNTVVDLLSQWSQDSDPLDQQYGRNRATGAHVPAYSSFSSNPAQQAPGYSQFTGNAGAFQGNMGAFPTNTNSYVPNTGSMMGNNSSFVSSNMASTNFAGSGGQRQYDFGRAGYQVNDFSSAQMPTNQLMGNSHRPTDSSYSVPGVSRSGGAGFYDQFASSSVGDASRGFTGPRGGVEMSQQHGTMLGMEQTTSSAGMYGADMQSSHGHGMMGMMGLPGGGGGSGVGGGGSTGISNSSIGMDSHLMGGYHQGGAGRPDDSIRTGGVQYGGQAMAAISLPSTQTSARPGQIHLKPDPGAMYPAQQVAIPSFLI
jgi:hypothetical protein